MGCKISQTKLLHLATRIRNFAIPQMATQHGSLREFHPESDAIKAYLERTSLYFSANDVPDAKKVAVLSTIGSPTYSLLSDLVAPDPPGEKSLAEIVEALCRHFEPKRTVIAERFHFHKRDQSMGECVADFDAALRKLVIHCNFADTLEDTHRDRFVCGLCSEAMQRQLLSEKGAVLPQGYGCCASHGSRGEGDQGSRGEGDQGAQTCRINYPQIRQSEFQA